MISGRYKVKRVIVDLMATSFAFLNGTTNQEAWRDPGGQRHQDG